MEVRGPTQIRCPSKGIVEVIGAARLSVDGRLGAAVAEKLRVVGRECLLVTSRPVAFPVGIGERVGRFGWTWRFLGVCDGEVARNRRGR